MGGTVEGSTARPVGIRRRRVLWGVVVATWLVVLYLMTVVAYNVGAILGADGRLW